MIKLAYQAKEKKLYLQVHRGYGELEKFIRNNVTAMLNNFIDNSQL
jgi:hypothetical protein